MIELTINKTLKYIENIYRKYGIDFTIEYNSDLEMITQYTRSLNTRTFFKNTDLQLINNLDLNNLNQESYILLMYYFSPLRRLQDRLNNINFEVVFSKPIPENTKFKKIDKYKTVNPEQIDFLTFIRDPESQNSSNLIIRDLVIGQLDFNCKFLTTSTKLINELQYIFVSQIQKLTSINLDFDFGADIGRIIIPFQTTFNNIEQIGHIDYNSFGNLQHLTFSFTISGPFFSTYVYSSPDLSIDEIDVDLRLVKPKGLSYDKIKQEFADEFQSN